MIAGSLPLQGLVVHPAFAGDDEIAALQVFFEVQQVEEVVGSGDDAAAEEEPGEAEPAGGAGSRGGGQVCRVGVSGGGQLVHQVVQPRIKVPDQVIGWRPSAGRRRRRPRRVR